MKFNTQKGFAPLILIIAVVVFAGIGGGAYYMSQKQKTATPAQNTNPTNQPSNNESSNTNTGEKEIINGTFFDLAGGNKNLECDWKPESLPNFKVAKVWISGNRVRSYVEATENMTQRSIKAHAIFKDNTLTSWAEVPGINPIGFRMSKADLEKANDSMTPDQEKQAEEYMKKSTYECRAWTVDESKFEVPSNITFYK